ncbi:ribonuclease Z [Pseudenhygromyxa sp. WMMC2535]|uniref:ribonuclease Z n=1 Tax=Pseudenhygromyxa sp. WMMC2535 TaxID=2712867 RepID=UPI00155666A5|nr:ribonuclease Z [Pseudenhygromyxa sp. WMMC2535]NVB37278.1 ribonuclease Z [Pseudenhygromyxa sp. WMMC2535]NVB43608.1 ribonuclease Z [Pseudenhygromyxa sp. WMMC2535]
MSVRELVVLGTASQVPTRYRNHNGYLLRWDGEGLLFDPGEGTQRQLIHAGVSSTDITKICITHFHGDHCLGLAGISQLLSLDGCPHPVNVYYPASGDKYYRRLRRASIYHDRAEVHSNPIREPGEIWRHEQAGRGVSLRVLPLSHGVPTYGYRLEEHAGWTMQPEKLREAGLRGPIIKQLQIDGQVEIEGRVVTLDDVALPRRGQVVAFVMDTRLCQNAFELAAGADMLICESTYLDEDIQRAKDNGHLTARQAGEIAAQAGARLLVLTHFSRRYDRTAPFLEQAREVFDGEVVAARDFDVLPVPKRLRPD